MKVMEKKNCTLIISERKCSDPGTPPEGSQLPSSYRLGDTVSFNCSKPGFMPMPVSTLTCIERGEELTWDGEVPSCKGDAIFFQFYLLSLITSEFHMFTFFLK